MTPTPPQKIREAVRRHFNNSACSAIECAEAQASIGKALIDYLSEQVGVKEQTTVVEIGCGKSSLLGQINHHQAPRRFIGIDVAEQLLRASHRACGHDCAGQTVHWLQADMTRLPLADASADLIVSSMSLHWASDVRQSLSEMMRVIKSDGWLALAIPVKPSLETLKQRAWRLAGLEILNPFWEPEDWQALLAQTTTYYRSFEHTKTYASADQAINHLRAIGANCLWQRDRLDGLPQPAQRNGNTVAKWRDLRRHPEWQQPIELTYRAGMWLLGCGSSDAD